MVNLERTCFLLFYYFLCFKANLDLVKTNQLGESSPNFIFAVVNLDPIILEKRWIDGESWPNDFVEKVNRGEDLRWVGSRCPLTHALHTRTTHNDVIRAFSRLAWNETETVQTYIHFNKILQNTQSYIQWGLPINREASLCYFAKQQTYMYSPIRIMFIPRASKC